MYDVAIIGAGVIGTFIGRELSRYKLKTVIIDKENDIANGTTKANSAIIHAGYDAEVGTNKGKFNALGNKMFDVVCEELKVPFKRIGSLVIGFDDDDMETIKKLYQNGMKLGIPNMEVIDGKKVLELEPNINENVIGALYAPTAGIIGVWELAMALAENAVENGVEILLNNKVNEIEKSEGGYKISTSENEIEARYVINCAGVYTDMINKMVAPESFKITPRRGHYFVLEKDSAKLFNRVIFQCPTKLGKGVLVTPTVHGNLLIGPDSEDILDKEGIETTFNRLDLVRNSSMKTSTEIPFNQVITSFSGLRAEPTNGDFIIEESKEAKGFINVAGIKSPGLSSAPAIAKYVVELVNNINGGLEENEKFNPTRKEVIHFQDLGDKEKDELIKKDSRYGRVICRCESITEGEIVDAINRKAGATTVDGVKRRVRPGSGICQGGFCGPRVMEILAKELKKDISEIVKDGKESIVITGETKNNKIYDKENELLATSTSLLREVTIC